MTYTGIRRERRSDETDEQWARRKIEDPRMHGVNLPGPWTHCVECALDLLTEVERMSGMCSTCAASDAPLHYRSRCLIDNETHEADVVAKHYTPQEAAECDCGSRGPECFATTSHKSGPAQLIRNRAARWSTRSDKWHAALERERAWSRRGLSVPVLVGAVAVLAVALLPREYTAGVQLVALLVASLFAWRASTAKTKLEVSRAVEAWATADRLTEWYRGVIVEVEHIKGSRDLEHSRMLSIYRESQKIEAGARFGLPEQVRAALDEVTR